MPEAVNEALKVILGRHSVRRFRDEGVDDALIRRLLEAANRAPSAENRQSWRFIVARGRKKTELAELCARRAAGYPRPASVLLRLAARTISAAPVVVAVANTGDLIRHGVDVFGGETGETRDFFRTMEIQSSAAAVENMLLAAASLGLGAVWLGILFLIKDDVLRLLGEPAGEFMAVVPVGWPAAETSGPRKRPLAAVVKTVE
jgi:nitroreductase